jgi:hypothetical protein
MTSAEWPSNEVREVAAEIAVLRNLDGGHVPSTVREFWRQFALDTGVDFSVDELAVAKAVSEALGIEFDDDYVDPATNAPTLSLYEAALATLQLSEPSTLGNGRDADVVEDDSDDTGVDLSTYIADVPPQPWTVRETVLRIQEGSLVLNPEWQRGFVWKLQKQRRLIESMLLGLPIPSFLFFEDSSTGKVYVIDGRQRLETISRYVSPKEEKGQPKVRFKTFNAKTVGWVDGQPLHPAANRYYSELPEPLRIKIERAPLVTFTFRDIPADLLYQIFKRYNTGAVALNAAEIRNAVYQASPLHGMMFRMGGEHRDPDKYLDEPERFVGEAIRQTMPKGKLERYGAYDFIGRYFAFKYQTVGSVAAATNSFMQKYGNKGDRVEGFRQEYIRTMEHTLDWYEYPLVEPKVDGIFHAMLGAIQLVATTVALQAIDNGALSREIVQQRISDEWPAFAQNVLQQKQNSTLFWSSHAAWNSQLTRT